MKIPTTRSKDPVVILRTVAKAILQEAKRYNQGIWFAEKGKRTGELYDEQIKEYPSCGTVACVAGWTCAVTRTPMTLGDTESEAQKLLALNGYGYYSDALFSADAISSTLKPGTKAYAKAGVEHIRRFVRSRWGKELGSDQAILGVATAKKRPRA